MKLLHENATSQSLAALRYYVFGLWLCKTLVEPMHLLSYMPQRIFEPIGPLVLFPQSVFSILLDPTFLHGLKIAILVSLLLALFGPIRRLGAVLACALLTLHEAIVRSCSHVNHNELPLLYAAIVLTLFEFADDFDKRRGLQVSPSANLHATPIRTIAFLLCLSYCFVGARRLADSGLDMFMRGGMDFWVIRNSFVPMDYDFRLGRLGLEYPIVRDLVNVAAIVTTVFEILAPLCLVFTRFRRVWLAYMFVFHINVMLTMNILFWENCAMFLTLVDYHRWVSSPRLSHGNQQAGEQS